MNIFARVSLTHEAYDALGHNYPTLILKEETENGPVERLRITPDFFQNFNDTCCSKNSNPWVCGKNHDRKIFSKSVPTEKFEVSSLCEGRIDHFQGTFETTGRIISFAPKLINREWLKRVDGSYNEVKYVDFNIDFFNNELKLTLKV